MRYFEQFPEVTPFGQRGSFHNKVRCTGCPCASSWLSIFDVLMSLRTCNISQLLNKGFVCALQAEWIVDLTTRADREGKHAEYANRYDRSDLKVANLKELNMQIDRGYRVRMQPWMLLPSAVFEWCCCWL